ncbi:MAG: ATPase, T2SS/T4P/T4SS family [Endomicrobiia bacterium]|nr:ATPase, T2SS/T4P/T4SS family [Endomicrobiia bacterium]
MSAAGKLLTIYETKEALGQAIIGVNFAIALAAQTAGRAGLCDLNFGGAGELGVLLNFQSNKHFNDLLPLISQMDERILKGFLVKHRSGVDVLPGISADFSPRDIKLDSIGAVIDLLKSMYPFVIASCENRVNSRTTAIFDESDLIFLVISPHLLSLNQAKRFLEQMKTLHYPLGMIKIVVNMADVKSGIPRKNIEEFVGAQIYAEIPYDSATVLPSINDGVPAIESAPQSNFSRAIKLIAQTIIKENEKFAADKSGIFAAALAGADDRRRARLAASLKKEEESRPTDDAEAKVNALKSKIHKRLLDEFDFKSLDPARPDLMKKNVREKIETILSEEGTEGLGREERGQMVLSLIDDVLGLGPLENLLRDDTVSEIMVNGTRDIFVEKSGKLYPTQENFASNDAIRTVVDRILAPIGRRVDESTPLVDARLSDGSRVNVIIPPLSLVGPVITIRKFTMKKLGIDDLVAYGAVTRDMVEFLRVCVNLRKNIVISGGTGSGKTTLLNMLSSFIPSDERIVTVEDSAELRLPQRHVITLESRPASIEGTGEIAIRRLVINALRMRPDRIVVGECRGGEALDMLQAMNTGHDGSLTTIHANTPKDAISRLITMVIMAGTELPERAIKEQIVGAINMVVQTSRISDGARKITQITEITGLEANEVKMHDLFIYKQRGVKDGKIYGDFVATGNKPTFMDAIKTHGIELDDKIFTPSAGGLR